MAKAFVRASSQYLEADVAIMTAPPFSVSAWFNSDDIASTQSIFWLGDKDVSNMMYGLNLFGGTLGCFQRDTGSTEAANSTISYSADTWHNGIGVYTSNASRTVYLDGGNSATNGVTQNAISEDRTSLGRSGDSTPGDYFSGRIAEVGIWNRAIFAGEIDLLSKGYSPMFFPSGLVFYMPLIRTTQDISKGFSLTEVNTPTVGNHPRIIRPSGIWSRRFTTAAAAATTLKDIIGRGLVPFAR